MMLPPEFLLAKLKGHGSPKDSATYRTYEGRSGTLDKTVNAPAFVEDFPVNLIKVNGSSQTINGVTFTVDKEKGTITANGTATTDTFYQGQYEGVIVDMTSILEDEPLFFSGCPVGGGGDTYFLRIYTQNNSHKNEFGDGVVVTNPRGFVGIKINEGYTCNNLVFKPMLVKGSQPRGFIPYGGGEVKTCGKNLFGGEALADKIVEIFNGIKDPVNKTVTYTASNYMDNKVLFDRFKENTQYSFIFTSKSSANRMNLAFTYENGTRIVFYSEVDKKTQIIVSNVGRSVSCVLGNFNNGNTTLYYEECGIFEGVITIDDFEPYIESSVFLAPDTPKPVAGLKTFGGVTNIVSDFDVKLIYAKRQDKYMEALLMNNMEIAPNAGAHNSIYRGKFLGNSVTDAQYAAIRSGRFDDMFIGDHWTIGGVNYRIAHFDYYLNSSDPPTTEHHAVLVPDTTMGECQFMNTQSGEYIAGTYNNMPNGYLGSGIYSGKLYDNTTDNAFAVAKNTIKAVFGEHILPHKLSFSSAVSGGKVSNTESAMSEIELMTERMVYGSVIFSPVSDGNNIPKYYEIEKTQLALFALDPSRIVSDRSWWLRDILSTTHVADVYQSGGADYSNSTNVYGVRPSFCIKG